MDLSKEELHTTLKYFFIAQAPYKVTICLNKVATILLYLRIFSSPRFRVAAFTIMGVVIAAGIGSIFATIFQCVPVAGAWNHSIKAQCIDSGQFWVAYAVMNVLTDFMVLVLPMPMVRGLKFGKRDKVMLYGLFLLGSFVTITSILRTTSVQNSLKSKMDITFNFIPRVILKQPLGILFPRVFGPSKKQPGVRRLGGDAEKGYTLSNLSTGQAGLWQGSNLAQQSVFISGPGTQAGRNSDEQHIFFEISRDSESDLEGKFPASGGISKKVEVVRTSVHQDRDYYHTGGYSGFWGTTEPPSSAKQGE
ncbi:hypothetical protein NLG97_g1375 [Lecanicillium saksenae]|uniref:Uncharacterized protein n=1 Tax=Lecanicillium saksenae TaxID=468837 RepID=A0ACC1R5B9_9HYPO|nr:hypothetical protein NLG97_g1375 [Lecanicillium saksenae]